MIILHLFRLFLPTPLGWLFVIPAWMLGWRAVCQLRRQWEAIRYERAVLARLRRSLPDAGGRDAQGRDAPPGRPDPFGEEEESLSPGRPGGASLPLTTADFDEWRRGIPRGGLIERLVETMWAQRAMQAPDLDAIHGMVADAAASRQTFPRGVPNLAMLCGLMGTVAGLAEVVHALGPQILVAAAAAEPTKLAEALAAQLGSLQTAFSCTLHGIFWAALVAWLLGRVEAEQELLLGTLHEFGLRDLAPRVFPRSLERHLEDLQKKLDESVALMGTVTAQMTHASDKLREHVGLLETATEATTQTLERVTAYFGQSAQVLGESVAALRALQVEVHGVYVSLMEKHEHSEQSFRQRAEDLIGTMDRLQGGYNTNTRAIIEQLQVASQNYAESTGQFREAGIRFGDMSREIGTRAYDAIAERAESFRAALVRHEQAAHLLESQLRDLMERLDPRLLPREEWRRVVEALEGVATLQASGASHRWATGGPPVAAPGGAASPQSDRGELASHTSNGRLTPDA